MLLKWIGARSSHSHFNIDTLRSAWLSFYDYIVHRSVVLSATASSNLKWYGVWLSTCVICPNAHESPYSHSPAQGLLTFPSPAMPPFMSSSSDSTFEHSVVEVLLEYVIGVFSSASPVGPTNMQRLRSVN